MHTTDNPSAPTPPHVSIGENEQPTAESLNLDVLKALQVPHPNRTQHGDATTLYSALQLEQTREALNALRGDSDTETFESLQAERAQEIVRGVNKALWFQDYEPTPDQRYKMPPDVENIAVNGVADCRGFTWASSVALEAAGIDHYVGVANGHAFLVVPGTHGLEGRAWVLDPVTPGIFQELPQGSLNGVDVQIEGRGRGLAQLDTAGLHDADNPTWGLKRLAEEHPWMAKGDSNDSDPYLPETNIALSVYKPEVGRSVLQHWAHFSRAVALEDREGAVQDLIAMRGLYPEVEPDDLDDLRFVQGLTDDLCRTGRFGDAELLVDAFYSSFVGTGDKAIAQSKRTCMQTMRHYVGRAVGANVLRSSHVQ